MASLIFFFNDTATTEIYTLSLHDALPIYHGQPEIEILAKPLLTHRTLEIAVGGRHDADVDLALAHAAHAAHGALLDRPQQLPLHREVHVADLVEEQESALGSLHQAGLRFLGIGERPALVAEQLGFHERGRQRRTVDLDERLGGPRARGVDG